MDRIGVRGMVPFCTGMALFLMGSSMAYGKTTLEFASWASGVEAKAIQRSVQEFSKQNPNISVKCTFTGYGDYFDKIMTQFTAGKPPDVMYIPHIRYDELVRRKLFLDITPMLKADKELTRPGFFFQPQENDRMLVDGKAYGIGCGWGAYWTYLNPATWQKAGMNPPSSDPDNCWTYDDFLAAARKLTQGPIEKPTVWGADPGVGGWLGMFSWLYSAGPELNRNRTAFTLTTDDRMLDAMQKLIDYTAKSGLYPKGVDTASGLTKGKLAMYMGGSWDLASLAPAMTKAKAPLELAPLPTMGTKASVLLQGHMHCIARTTKHSKEAWKLLQWVSGSQHQREMVEIGLWPPGRGDLTTPEAQKTWMRAGIHPSSYVNVGVKYIMKYGRAMVAPPGYDKIEGEIWNKFMPPVNSGKKALMEVLPGMVKEMNRALTEGMKRVSK